MAQQIKILRQGPASPPVPANLAYGELAVNKAGVVFVGEENGQPVTVDRDQKTLRHSWTETGVYTWTVPAGVYKVDVWVCGGGGGASAGGYGGGGGYWTLYRGVSVTPAAQISITVGAGGAEGLSGGFSQFKDENYKQFGGGIYAEGRAGSGGSGGGATSGNSAGGNGGFGGGDGGYGFPYASEYQPLYVGGTGGRCIPPYNPYDGEYYGGGGGGTGKTATNGGIGGPHAGSARGTGTLAEDGYGGGGAGLDGFRTGGCGCVKIYY